MILQIAPVLLGEGIPLFSQKEGRKRFALKEVKKYGPFAELVYIRAWRCTKCTAGDLTFKETENFTSSLITDRDLLEGLIFLCKLTQIMNEKKSENIFVTMDKLWQMSENTLVK